MTSTLDRPRTASGSVVTVGETMALLTTPTAGQLHTGSVMPVGIGGAESNVAIALARLDVPSTWISRVGDDALGGLVIRTIRAEGVRVVANRDPDAPTGLMVKENRGGRPWRVRYYRSTSAASRLSVADLDPTAISEATVLHVTGITAAIGEEPLAAIERAIDIARAASTLVSFDINYRSSLWAPEDASPVLARLVAQADLVFAGAEEAALVLGWPTPDQQTFDDGEHLARGLAKRGPATVVIKLGALGSLALAGDRTHQAPTRPVTVVDAVGAGDAFVGGYLSQLVAGGTVSDCLTMGNVLGAAVCQVPGDWEGLPTKAELEFTAAGDDVVR